MPSHGLTHAGGVVRRDGPDGATFLLVRARRFPFDWVLPKGHIERGETPEQTAFREVCEEAGVDAEINRAVGDLNFRARGRSVRVRYFAMSYRSEVAATEEREVRWCSLTEAVELLEFDDARDLVRRTASLT